MYLRDCPLTFGERFKRLLGAPGRVCSLEEIERRANSVLDKVPITRISDISRLELSAAPVFSATTPLARDLTSHMGKGLTLAAARISAVMEAIERISAETVRLDTTRASYSKLSARGRVCVDPEQFDLPPTTAYHPDRPIDWVAGWDLVGRCEILVPVDLCISPPRRELLDQVDTNGLASGATFGEAIRHALLEVIERDASGQQLFFELFGVDRSSMPARRRIGRTTLPASSLEFVRKIETKHIRAVLEEITNDVGIPVMACYLVDFEYLTANGPVQMIFGGWGCDPDPEQATNRALSEAHQSRIGTIQGTRDSFNLIQDSDREFTRQMRSSIIEDAAEVEFKGTSKATDSIAADVETIIDRLRAIGVEYVVAVDMSNPELGIPVVRVRVPGLSQFMVDRCRVGWRCMRHIL